MSTHAYRDGQGTGTEDIRPAFQRWVRSVSGAPRKLDEQIIGVERHEEVLCRLATTVVRRDIIAVRGAIPSYARPKGAAISAHSVDPFATTPDALRNRSEHVEPCDDCGGSGRCACGACAGSGRQRCGGCAGSGRTVRYYKKSSRVINCPACRGAGTSACVACNHRGSVPCGGCEASGRVLEWLELRESRRTTVRFSMDSPVLHAHRYLFDERPMRLSDLASFRVCALVEAEGSISTGQLTADDQTVCQAISPPIDDQHERLSGQQFVRIEVLRQDVSYEMCGTRGVVVLSGNDLVAAGTDEALRPIKRRKLAWFVLSVLVVLGGLAYAGAWLGPTAYFESVNSTIVWVALLGAAAAVFVVGGALRALRPGLRFWPLTSAERVGIGVSALAFALCPMVYLVGRPTIAEARAAIARSDPERAGVVAEALHATQPSLEISSLLDDIDLAQARHLQSDARLARLDAATARHGNRANEARVEARQERLGIVRSSLNAHQYAEALSRLDQWSASLQGDAEASELKAQVFDAQRAACSDDLCRIAQTGAACAAHATPERDGAEATLRARVLSALASRPAAGNDLVAMVRSLRSIGAFAERVSAIHGEPELAVAASSANAWVIEQMSEITLLDVPTSVVEDLLDRPPGSDSATGWPGLADVAVYPSDVNGRCDGLYVVGATAGMHSLVGHEHGVEHLLARATGQSDASLHAAPTSAHAHGTVHWREGRFPIVARWNDGALIEVRIGDAMP